MNAKDAARARFRRIVRPWRIAFIAYVMLLTLGTHWPRLELPPEVPATDKTVHLAAFGMFTILLWQTRWIRSLLVLALTVLIWAACDEISQGIPGIHRDVSIYDYGANAMGVVAAIAWIWALRPQGMIDAANRLRHRLFQFTVEEMFADIRAWIAGVIGLATGGLPLLGYWLIAHPDVDSIRTVVVIAAFACAITTYLIWMQVWKRHFARVQSDRPCLNCGHSLGVSAFDHADSIMCSECGSHESKKHWLQLTPPSRRVILRIARRPALIGMACLVLGFAAIFFIPVVYAAMINHGGASARMAPGLARRFGTLPPEFTRTIDLFASLLLFAGVTRLYRAGLARFYDQASRCIKCGHDLRGTPSMNSIGRCGECGTPFVRAAKI